MRCRQRIQGNLEKNVEQTFSNDPFNTQCHSTHFNHLAHKIIITAAVWAWIEIAHCRFQKLTHFHHYSLILFLLYHEKKNSKRQKFLAIIVVVFKAPYWQILPLSKGEARSFGPLRAVYITANFAYLFRWEEESRRERVFVCVIFRRVPSIFLITLNWKLCNLIGKLEFVSEWCVHVQCRVI